MISLTNYIQKVKTKSEEDKQSVVFTWTIVLIFIIFLVWVTTFSLSVSNTQKRNLELKKEAEMVKSSETTAGTSLWLKKSWQSVSEIADSVALGFWVVVDRLH